MRSTDIVHVVNKMGLKFLFRRKEEDSHWKAIECIQSNVKSMIGCGYPIIVNFYAPITKEGRDVKIVYDTKQFPSDSVLIKHDEQEYCLKLVYKMCYFIQTHHKFDILRMKCHFVKDDNKVIWLQYVKDIWSRQTFQFDQEDQKQTSNKTPDFN